MAISTVPARRKRRLEEEDLYPSSDGKIMAETELHRDLMIYFIEALKAHYLSRADVQVSGNNFIYYDQDNPKARVSPDCYVVFGVEKRMRNSYMVWKETGILPSVVFEFTSAKTQKEDVAIKRPLYEGVLKVPEYFQFDPIGDYLNPRLQGFRLEGGRYIALKLVDGRLHSVQLGLDLVLAEEWVRLYDPSAAEYLLSPQEEHAARIAKARALAEAEAEIARLRAQLHRLRERPS